jgi:hypothetical protein
MVLTKSAVVTATAVILAVSATCLLAEEPPVSQDDIFSDLSAFVEKVEGALPAGWHVVETDTGGTPIGWTGESAGFYVMVEDTATRFFHPKGFHYFSFYRLWLMPSDWEGEMRRTPYVSDSSPAYLLGVSDSFLALYHSAGGNVWEDGPGELCEALELDRICYTDLTRRTVDLEIEEKLKQKLDELPDASTSISPRRIIGLTGDGANLYIEYLFSPDDERTPGEQLAALTDALAGDVFLSLPEIESLYLRRCTADTYTDTIVHRN